MRLCSRIATRVVKTLSGFDVVVGLTSLAEELFVLHKRADKQVEVYSTKTFTALRKLSISGLHVIRFNDIISCEHLHCLYISDFMNSCIHRTKPSGAVIAKWPLSDAPLGLSLTPANHILVTCTGSHKLLELCSDSGECVREVKLQSDVQYLLHAIQLPSRHYLLSHTDFSELYRVSVVDVDGQVPPRHGFDVAQLNGLHHVTTDQYDFLFIGDYKERRVVVLRPSLELVRHIDLQQEPFTLHLDHATRCLYVGLESGDVTVIQV